MHKLYQTTHIEHEKPVQGTVKELMCRSLYVTVLKHTGVVFGKNSSYTIHIFHPSTLGDIPDWVKGSLYRNGPGLYEVGEDKYNHLFDPLAMFQRFHIENKTATYQNRFLQSDTYKKNTSANRIVIYGPGTMAVPDPCLNMFQRFLTYFTPEERNDNTNVSFIPMGDELYSSTETHFIHKIDPDTLETMKKINLADYVAVMSNTAHPHWDPDGTVHSLAQSFKGGPKHNIVKIPPKQEGDGERFEKAKIVASIRSPWKMSINYIHSFGMTENYYIYVEQPLFINLLKALTSNIRGVAKSKCIEWCPSIKTRFRIINKSTGEEVNPEFQYLADPALVFHHINAYEDNGHIVVDLCGTSNAESLDNIYLKDLTSEHYEEKVRNMVQPEPRRYVLPVQITNDTPVGHNLVKLQYSMATAVKTDQVIMCTWEALAETGMEFPNINYRHFNGRKYKYAYALGFHCTGDNFNTVIKVNTETKTYLEWGEAKCYPSEPVFVPNPAASSEDDGVVLVAVNSSDFDLGVNAFLLVLDAKTMTELARVEFDNIARFPRDFHGIFRTK